MQADQVNLGITQQNLSTAREIEQYNDAMAAGDAKIKSEAMKGISQFSQKVRLEGNMREKNEILKNALKDISTNYNVNPATGDITAKDGTAVDQTTKNQIWGMLMQLSGGGGMYTNNYPGGTYQYSMGTSMPYGTEKKGG